MTPFIFFHGIAINTANMLTGVIERNLDDATKSRLYITTENSGERHALDVDYDTATSEWARVWVDITKERETHHGAQRKPNGECTCWNCVRERSGVLFP